MFDLVLVIMSGVALLAVGRAVLKIIANRKHITEAEFRAYMNAGRRMSDDERSRVTSHLGICDACQGQIEDWVKGNPPEDPILED